MAQRHKAGSGKGGQFAARKAAQMPESAKPETGRRRGRRSAEIEGDPRDPLDQEALRSTRERIRRLNRQAGGLGGAGLAACIPMVLALPGVYDGIPEGWQGMTIATSGATALVLFWAAAGRRHIAACDLRRSIDGTARHLGMPPSASVSMDQSTIVGWLLDDHAAEGAEPPPPGLAADAGAPPAGEAPPLGVSGPAAHAAADDAQADADSQTPADLPAELPAAAS